jgi:hypothetical protein
LWQLESNGKIIRERKRLPDSCHERERDGPRSLPSKIFSNQRMAQIDPRSSASDAVPAGITPQKMAPAGESPFAEKRGRLLALAITAGLIAGAASWFAGEVIFNRYESDLTPTLKLQPTPDDMRRWRHAQLYSATLTFAALGGLFGLAMGFSGGLGRRSVIASTTAAILGLVLGTVAAFSVAILLVSNFYKKHEPQSVDMVLPLLTHGGIWAAVGAIGGLAFGLGLGAHGRWKTSVLGGVLGAAAATVIYEIVGALAFASLKTDLPLSASITTRGMAQLLVATLPAVGIGVALGQSPKRKAESSAPP